MHFQKADVLSFLWNFLSSNDTIGNLPSRSWASEPTADASYTGTAKGVFSAWEMVRMKTQNSLTRKEISRQRKAVLPHGEDQ